MSKSKNRDRESKSQAPVRSSSAIPRVRPPAWRSRLGLIIAFFAITIGGAYWYVIQANARLSNLRTYGFQVVKSHKHDPEAFTEGLLYHDGKIYESTGLQGRSTIRMTDLATGQQTVEKLDDNLFGEGLVLWRDRLIQLTYDSGIALLYDPNLKRLEQNFEYDGQGWGITHDGRHLIMSNGTSALQFRDPETFALDHRLTVTVGGRPISRLNELEYVNGKIYANVWHDNYLLEIDPTSGQVTARVDLNGLLPRSQRPQNSEGVLNGIAYNPETKTFFVTGKYWPFIYEIELVAPSTQ